MIFDLGLFKPTDFSSTEFPDITIQLRRRSCDYKSIDVRVCLDLTVNNAVVCVYDVESGRVSFQSGHSGSSAYV